MNYMNVFFTAQKLNIPVEVELLGGEKHVHVVHVLGCAVPTGGEHQHSCNNLTPRSSRGLLPIHMCKCHRHCPGKQRFIGSAVLPVALISSDHLRNFAPHNSFDNSEFFILSVLLSQKLSFFFDFCGGEEERAA